MEKYKNILVAIELNPERDNKLIDAAQEMAAKTGAAISLLHAVEYVGALGGMYGISIPIDIEEKMAQEAKEKLAEIGATVGIPAERQIADLEMYRGAIAQKADELGVDLIIVGSHGRHGLDRLIGSTANAILHRAKCDVLVIRTAA